MRKEVNAEYRDLFVPLSFQTKEPTKRLLSFLTLFISTIDDRQAIQNVHQIQERKRALKYGDESKIPNTHYRRSGTIRPEQKHDFLTKTGPTNTPFVF
jgi:hypothetical protein